MRSSSSSSSRKADRHKFHYRRIIIVPCTQYSQPQARCATAFILLSNGKRERTHTGGYRTDTTKTRKIERTPFGYMYCMSYTHHRDNHVIYQSRPPCINRTSSRAAVLRKKKIPLPPAIASKTNPKTARFSTQEYTHEVCAPALHLEPRI